MSKNTNQVAIDSAKMDNPGRNQKIFGQIGWESKNPTRNRRFLTQVSRVFGAESVDKSKTALIAGFGVVVFRFVRA